MPHAADLGVTDVLDVVVNLYQLDGEVHGDEYKILCPVHPDSSPSADVNINTGLWSCWSCGAKGDLAGLGVDVLKKLPPKANARLKTEARNEIIELLKPSSPTKRLTVAQRKIELARTIHSPVAVRRNPLRLPPPRRYVAEPLDYMRERGFTNRTLKRWGVRFAPSQTLVKADGDEFTVKNNIAIPIRNAENKLQAWAYRATPESDDWQPKMIYTPMFDLSGNWFGIHLHHDEPEIFICEGPLDAMWLDQNGFPALAMMGSNHKNPRKFRMISHYKRVTVVPDYDHGGVMMTERLGSVLRGQVPVFVARWPKGVVERTGKEKPDPQDVRRKRDLELIISRTIPFQAWALKQSLPN